MDKNKLTINHKVHKLIIKVGIIFTPTYLYSRSSAGLCLKVLVAVVLVVVASSSDFVGLFSVWRWQKALFCLSKYLKRMKSLQFSAFFFIHSSY